MGVWQMPVEARHLMSEHPLPRRNNAAQSTPRIMRTELAFTNARFANSHEEAMIDAKIRVALLIGVRVE